MVAVATMPKSVGARVTVRASMSTTTASVDHDANRCFPSGDSSAIVPLAMTSDSAAIGSTPSRSGGAGVAAAPVAASSQLSSNAE